MNEPLTWQTRVMIGLLGVCLVIAGWVEAADTISWWHVLVIWLGAAIVFVAIWASLPRDTIGWKQCPLCGGEGTIAFVTEDWVVTCHGYFWTLTDDELIHLADDAR